MITSDVESNNTISNGDKEIISSYDVDDINRNDLIDEDDDRVNGIDDEVMNELGHNELNDDLNDDDGRGAQEDSIIPQQVSKKFKSDVKKPKTKWVIYSSEVC